MELLSQLRKELAASPHPDRHVFELTREQERQIIKLADSLASYFHDLPPAEHISFLFGRPVRLLD